MENQSIEILRQPMFKTPMMIGPFDPNREGGYNEMNQVSLFGAVWESKRDNNQTAPAVWDGGDIITPNTTDWFMVSGDYEAWLLNKDKPAATGTTGDYPYNGLGRVILRKNMVSGVNTLTQDMFYKGEVGSRVPNTNTVFVVKYDFVLGEDITIPDNCVLEFDGGSISGAYTLTLNDTLIEGLNCISYATILAGICKNEDILVEWFIGTDLQKIQAAMDYANVAIIEDETTGNTCFKIIYKRVVFGNSKQYIIDASINLPDYGNIEGNNAVIKITTTNNIFQASEGHAYITNIKNLTFIGNDVCALYLNIGNLDGSFTTLHNLTFWTNTRTSGKFAVYLYNVSSQCVIERCTIKDGSNFLKVRCDSLIIKDSWIEKGGTGVVQDTPSMELSEGCRYARIENCQFVPTIDCSYDYRWIDLKGGSISITNCIFGGEVAGIPIIWLYTSSNNDISIYDSQIACGGSRTKAGIIVPMNNALPTNIRIKNCWWEFSRVINPYGYVKDGVTEYDNTKLQQAFDLFMDKIISVKGLINIDSPQSPWQINYGLNPFFTSDKGKYIINNANIANTYNIATGYRQNTDGDKVSVDYDIDIILTGADNNGSLYTAVYKYNVLMSQNFNLWNSKVSLIDKYVSEYNQDAVLPYLTVNFDGSNLSFSSTSQTLTIDRIQYVIHDNSRCYPNNYPALYFYPQKCNETIR